MFTSYEYAAFFSSEYSFALPFLRVISTSMLVPAFMFYNIRFDFSFILAVDNVFWFFVLPPSCLGTNTVLVMVERVPTRMAFSSRSAQAKQNVTVYKKFDVLSPSRPPYVIELSSRVMV